MLCRVSGGSPGIVAFCPGSARWRRRCALRSAGPASWCAPHSKTIPYLGEPGEHHTFVACVWSIRVPGPTTWTIFQQDGPNHLRFFMIVQMLRLLRGNGWNEKGLVGRLPPPNEPPHRPRRAGHMRNHSRAARPMQHVAPRRNPRAVKRPFDRSGFGSLSHFCPRVRRGREPIVQLYVASLDPTSATHAGRHSVVVHRGTFTFHLTTPQQPPRTTSPNNPPIGQNPR